MYILGINAYHGGASACLIQDGMLVAAAEEERFNRQKYSAGFPVSAIRYVLSEAGIGAEALDHIGVSHDPSAHLLEKVLMTLKRRPNLALIRNRLQHGFRVGRLASVFCEHMGLPESRLKARFHNVEHHHAHLASAFFVSPFEEATVLSVDGMGDFVSTMWGVGKGTRLTVSDSISYPHSLGYLYTAVSQWLGFPSYGDEGKVMGLAPYGTPSRMDEMSRILRTHADGTFELDLDYFDLFNRGVTMTWETGEPAVERMFSAKMADLLGPPREPRTAITPAHEDVAASLQATLERAELALITRLQRDTGQRALCMAGGVALNSVVNGRILPGTAFDDIFIQPAAGDSGTSLGVCYYIHHHVLGHPRAFVMTDSYTGSQYTNEENRRELDRLGLHYAVLDDDALTARAAEAIAAGDVVGWFQGRMEWGPRALGNRSILADPRKAAMKDTLNARIKHREPFRPFAPSIAAEAVGDYFDQTYPDPFMLKVYGVRPERRAEIPAVTHVDGTGRLQTVDRATTPLYWQLIDAFRQRTGTPVVLNTSFNENEPIVRTPAEAVDCFLRTRMDALALGNQFVTRRE